MPVTARKLLVRNISGAGKKGPNYKYSHGSGSVVQSGCETCRPPPSITLTYNTPGTYTYTLPSWKSWTITYQVLGGGGGGGGGSSSISGIGDGLPGNAGGDSILVSSSFTTSSNTLYIVVGDGGFGGFRGIGAAPATSGGLGSNSSISDTVTPTYISIGGTIGIAGAGQAPGGPFTSAPVSGLPGTGGRGGNSDSDGLKGQAGYVTFTATPVP